MGDKPVFIASPKSWLAQISAANTNRDGTGTLVDVLTVAAVAGARIDSIVVQAIGTTTAGMVRLFLFDGTNTRLWRELAVAAIVPSGTVAAFRDTIPLGEGLILPTGWKLKAGTHNAETFNIVASGGEL